MLGAGKTAFVRGLARGPRRARGRRQQPTFTLIQEYRGRLVLHHVDLYRLNPREVEDLGLDDLISSGGVRGAWNGRSDGRIGRPAAREVWIEDLGGDRRAADR